MSDIFYKDESFKIIGACLSVHNELGCGFLEPVYHEALEYEFKLLKIPYISECQLPVRYKNMTLSKTYAADFVCFDKIIVEIKAVSDLCSEHEAQVINYLKAAKIQLGILVNFGKTSLQYKRILNKSFLSTN